MYVNYLAPVTDQKKSCGVGGHPTRSGMNILKFHLAYYLTINLAFYPTSLLTFCRTFYLTLYVTSCARSRGSIVPTEIWRSRLRSDSAH